MSRAGGSDPEGPVKVWRSSPQPHRGWMVLTIKGCPNWLTKYHCCREARASEKKMLLIWGDTRAPRLSPLRAGTLLAFTEMLHPTKQASPPCRGLYPSRPTRFPKIGLEEAGYGGQASRLPAVKDNGMGKGPHVPPIPARQSGAVALVPAALQGGSGCLSRHQSSAEAARCPLAFEHGGFTLAFFLLLPKELVACCGAGHQHPKSLGQDRRESSHQKCLIQSPEWFLFARNLSPNSLK